MHSPYRVKLILLVCLCSSTGHCSGILKRCFAFLRTSSTPENKPINPAFLPQIVTPSLQEATYRMFELGPNRWAQTGQKPKGIEFQRSFGGIHDSKGAGQTLETLSGAPLDASAHVFKLDTRARRADADKSAGIFSKPIAIRGKIDAGLLLAPRNEQLKDEAIVAAGTSLAPQITEMAISYSPVESAISPLTATTRISWGKSYVDIYKKMKASGMQIDPESRGGKFAAEMEELYSSDVPIIPYYMSSDRGDFTRFFNEHRGFISRLQEILIKYQNE